MLFSVLRLLFVLFAKNVIADLLVIFRHVSKIKKKKATIGCVMSVSPSVHPHVVTRLLLVGFS